MLFKSEIPGLVQIELKWKSMKNPEERAIHVPTGSWDIVVQSHISSPLGHHHFLDFKMIHFSTLMSSQSSIWEITTPIKLDVT